MSEGLYSKYIVTKADTGESVDNCFVLRPDKDPAALKALQFYARNCEDYQLRDDIEYWLAGPEMNPELTMEDLSKMRGEEIFITHQGYTICWGIDPNENSPWGPRMDCGEGRGLSMFGFNETWRAYRRRPYYLFARYNDES